MKTVLVKLAAMAALVCFLAGLLFRGQGSASSFFTVLGFLLLGGTLLQIFRSGGEDDE